MKFFCNSLVPGVCADGINSFTCNCTSGFHGKTCHSGTNECVPNPCVNNGTCADAHLDYNVSLVFDFFTRTDRTTHEMWLLKYSLAQIKTSIFNLCRIEAVDLKILQRNLKWRISDSWLRPHDLLNVVMWSYYKVSNNIIIIIIIRIFHTYTC